MMGSLCINEHIPDAGFSGLGFGELSRNHEGMLANLAIDRKNGMMVNLFRE